MHRRMRAGPSAACRAGRAEVAPWQCSWRRAWPRESTLVHDAQQYRMQRNACIWRCPCMRVKPGRIRFMFYQMPAVL